MKGRHIHATPEKQLRYYRTVSFLCLDLACINTLLSGVLYRKVPPQERWKISGLDGTHTGAMVLYYGFDEQA